MRLELEACNFVSIGTDASNHVAVKMFPIIARWFNPLEGIKTKVLDLCDETGLINQLFHCIYEKSDKRKELFQNDDFVN